MHLQYMLSKKKKNKQPACINTVQHSTAGRLDVCFSSLADGHAVQAVRTVASIACPRVASAETCPVYGIGCFGRGPCAI